MYSIFAPGKTALNVADAGNAVVALTTPQIQDYLASNVQANARQRGYIVNRTQSGSRADLIDVTVSLIDHTGDLEGDVAEKARLRDVIATWARRSRVPGVSGDRVAVVGPFEQTRSMDGNPGDVDIYQVMLRIGTAVFFNDRRVTVDFAQDKLEFTQDLKNLFDHLARAGVVGMLNGVIVEHEEFGEIHSGNTTYHAVDHSGSMGRAPVQAQPAAPAAHVAPAVQAPVATAPVATAAPVAAPVMTPVAAPVVLAKAPMSDADLEDMVNTVRVFSATLRVTDRAGLSQALKALSDKVNELQAAL